MKKQELERMANSIEATLKNHGAPVRVTGGTILPYHVKFDALPRPGTKISQIKRLVEGSCLLASAQVFRRGARVVIVVRRQEAATLDSLLNDIEPMRFTAALGIEERKNGSAPLLVNLESKEGAHVLIIGQERDELLTIMAESLQRWNEPGALRMHWIDGEGSLTVDAVARRKETQPVMVLLTNGDGLTPTLRHSMARKVQNGVHVIMSSTGRYIDDELRKLFPCRIRGLGSGRYEAVAEDWAGTLFYTPRI